MILYVNGDSHTAAAEAANPHAFAGDDGLFDPADRSPHPDNLAVSWGQILAKLSLNAFKCGAESASSNDRIIRTTREWLAWNKLSRTDNFNPLVIIQWSTWEREEWLHNGVYYQVNASGIDMVPQELQEKYRQYILGIDWQQKTQECHNKIWSFHRELLAMDVPHIFFNGNNDFGIIEDQQDWGLHYIAPYNVNMTYDSILRSSGYKTVRPDSGHFGQEAHSFFAQYMLQYIIDNRFY
jgi:hypothetical protein